MAKKAKKQESFEWLEQYCETYRDEKTLFVVPETKMVFLGSRKDDCINYAKTHNLEYEEVKNPLFGTKAEEAEDTEETETDPEE